MALEAVSQDAVGMVALSAIADAQGDNSSVAGSIDSFETGNVSSIETHPPPLVNEFLEGGTV